MSSISSIWQMWFKKTRLQCNQHITAGYWQEAPYFPIHRFLTHLRVYTQHKLQHLNHKYLIIKPNATHRTSNICLILQLTRCRVNHWSSSLLNLIFIPSFLLQTHLLWLLPCWSNEPITTCPKTGLHVVEIQNLFDARLRFCGCLSVNVWRLSVPRTNVNTYSASQFSNPSQLYGHPLCWCSLI